jgi:uncharacterized protein (DUF1015 family)
LAFRGRENIRQLIEEAVKTEPIYDFCCAGGVQHTFWKAQRPESWVEAFAEVPALYIADGHHRVESAELARKKLASEDPDHTGNEEYNYVLAGIFPTEELRILAYNRAVTKLNGISDDEFLSRLAEHFIVTETGETRPDTTGNICMYFAGKWYNLRFAINYIRRPDPIDRLDVTILQNYVLRPILGIEDERTDDRILFVGGSGSPEKLQRVVDEGHARVAFSLYPTSIEDLLEVSDRGEIMPPKSTWFDPKLKDGILIHLI